MKVLGVDFTSRPSRRKPITCARCALDDGVLRFAGLDEWRDYAGFEAALAAPGPWIAGLDFPFGQAQRFIDTIGWPPAWSDYVPHAGGRGRAGFRAALDAYRHSRAPGDKEHRRAADVATSAISPQKLHGVPVGLMFFEGAPRLVTSGVTIPLLHAGDPERIVVEAYPGALARRLIGRVGYKNDSRAKQTVAQCEARGRLLARLRGDAVAAALGFAVDAPDTLADDPSGDALDALLCAVQAGWSWTRRDASFGAPSGVNPREGWIADPFAEAAGA